MVQIFREPLLIGSVLAEAGLDFGTVVEVNSLHIGLTARFDVFNKVRGA